MKFYRTSLFSIFIVFSCLSLLQPLYYANHSDNTHKCHKNTQHQTSKIKVASNIDKKQIIFVIPSTESFKNSYLVFQRDEIEKIISTLATTKYEKIMTYDTFSYLTHTKIVKKFPYGTTGLEPMFTFKIR